MKKFFLALMPVFCAGILFAQTYIPAGPVSGNWEESGSPFYIQGNITINTGETLIIDPGVEIIFQGHYWFNVYGNLQAIGTENDSILFSAENTASGWNALRFSNAEGMNEILYCRFQHSHSTIDGGAIACANSGLELAYSTFCWNTSTQPDYAFGGAVYIADCPLSVYVHDCYFHDNSAVGYLSSGGAVFADNSSPVIEHCIIESNSGEDSGGGIAISYESVNVMITNCLILNNQTGTVGGGGIAIGYDSEVTIENCTITANYAEGVCGGIGVVDNCILEMTDCLIEANETNESAGGIGLGTNCTLSMENCIVRNNFAALLTGGIGITSGSQATIIECEITYNECSEEGGGIAVKNSYAEIAQSTIAFNSAGLGGGLYCEINGDPVLNSTLLWANTATHGNQVYLAANVDDPNFYYCNVEGGRDEFGGAGAGTNFSGDWVACIDNDPLFEDPEINEFYLMEDSPCIDAGDPAQENDPDGTMADIGAYYFDHQPVVALEPTDISNTGFTAHWEIATEVLGFLLDVAYDEDFVDFVEGYQNLNVGNVMSYFVSGLEPGMTYFYRLRANYYFGRSGYSNTIMTSTLTSVDELDSPVSGMLTLLPNPCSASTTVAFTLTNDAFVELAVYDLTGQLVAPLISELLPQGGQKVVFPTTGLSPGIYFCALKVADKLQTIKLIRLE